MRCRICGAKLAKEDADICLNCYKSYQEDEDLKKDVKDQLVVKRKYKIAYILLKYLELIVIFILATLGSILYGGVLEGVLCVFISIVIMVGILIIHKRIARNTRATFYEKKVRYTFKSILFNTDKTVKYSDIKDISVFQTYRQKQMGFGDICIYAKGNIPGATLLNGFQIKDVENVYDVVQEIMQIVGTIEK